MNYKMKYLLTTCLILFHLVTLTNSNPVKVCYEIFPTFGSFENSSLIIRSDSSKNASNDLSLCFRVKFQVRKYTELIHSDSIKLEIEEYT